MIVPVPPPLPKNGILSNNHGASVQERGGPSSGGPPPPPPPQPALVDKSRFKVVPGLGEALHAAKLKICGVEETPACAEGVSAGGGGGASGSSSGASSTTAIRPKSWHGRLQPNKAVINEMQNKLAARRAKVDQESDTVPAPNIGRPPRSGQSGDKNERKVSLPTVTRGYTPPTSRGRTPSMDFGADWTPVLNRKYSQDSGVYTGSREMSGTPPVTPNQYRRVSVDIERKEELMLAKQVRQNSVKILRMSPVNGPSLQQQRESSVDELANVPVTSTTCSTSATPAPDVSSPSPIVMRYWNQCTGSDKAEESIDDTDETKVETWKDVALEGDETQFPSIKQKIHQMEEEAKTKMVTRVPDVKRNLNLGEVKTAGWMEARKKLQVQLDTLLTKTSAKMAAFTKGTDTATEHTIEVECNSTQPSSSESNQSHITHTELDPNVKSLIKSVANEIQKSFSQKNMDLEEKEDDELSTEKEEDNGNSEVDSGIEEKSIEEESKVRELYSHPEPSTEAPIDFDTLPVVLDSSVSREKMRIVRKSSRERRLPTNILAKRKAAEKLRTIIAKQDADDDTEQNVAVISDTIKELIVPDNKSDEEKLDSLAKEMSKLESSQILEILQTVEKGALEFSIPLLLPFLSLQVKLSMSKSLYGGYDTGVKTKLLKESILDSLVNDITDIAILQEVITSSQQRLYSLMEQQDTIKHSSTQSEWPDMKDAFTMMDAEICQSAQTQPNNDRNNLKESEELERDHSKNEDSSNDIKCSIKKSETEATSTNKKEESVEEKQTKVSDSSEKSDDNEKSDDSGVDSEENNVEEKISKSKSEKDIKKALMNILNDAKAQEKTKNVRNYGRNFEFQQISLKPTIPNDRRTAKAKRMDSMWTQQIAAKTGNYNGIPVAPKQTPKAPWTMKSSPSSNAKDQTKTNKETTKVESSTASTKKTKSDAEATKSTKQDKEPSDEALTETKVDSREINSEDLKDAPKENVAQKVEQTVDVYKIEKSASNNIEEEKISIHEEIVTSSQPDSDKKCDIEMEKADSPSEIDSEIDEQSFTLCSSSSSEWEYSEDEEEDSNASDEKIKKSISKSPECPVVASKKDSSIAMNVSTNSQTLTIKEDKEKCLNNVPAVFLTPVTRRRMEMTTTSVTVTVPLSGPPPPPPAFRPPPPPMSPTNGKQNAQEMIQTTTTRFENLQNEVYSRNETKPVTNVCISKENDASSGEETEWEEWTETEESEYETEDEDEAEEKGDNWNESSGPTSFTAEYSITI